MKKGKELSSVLKIHFSVISFIPISENLLKAFNNSLKLLISLSVKIFFLLCPTMLYIDKSSLSVGFFVLLFLLSFLFLFDKIHFSNLIISIKNKTSIYCIFEFEIFWNTKMTNVSETSFIITMVYNKNSLL